MGETMGSMCLEKKGGRCCIREEEEEEGKDSPKNPEIKIKFKKAPKPTERGKG